MSDKHALDYIRSWKKAYIRDQDLKVIFLDQDVKRYNFVKYNMQKGVLTRIVRGLYQINFPEKQLSLEPFELAQVIYSPSYVSLESALSYYNWIPESVLSITSVTSKRSKQIDSSIGMFVYKKIPVKSFYQCVSRVDLDGGGCLIATPWRALSDLIFLNKKKYSCLSDLRLDLRIEEEDLYQDINSLRLLMKEYPSNRVKLALSKFLRELDG